MVYTVESKDKITLQQTLYLNGMAIHFAVINGQGTVDVPDSITAEFLEANILKPLLLAIVKDTPKAEETIKEAKQEQKQENNTEKAESETPSTENTQSAAESKPAAPTKKAAPKKTTSTTKKTAAKRSRKKKK